MIDHVGRAPGDLHLQLQVGEGLPIDVDVGIGDGQDGRSTGQALGQQLSASAYEAADIEADGGEDEAHRQQHEAGDRRRLRAEVEDAAGVRREGIEQQHPSDDGQDDADDGEDFHGPER